MKLDGLANGDVGKVASVLPRESADDAKLVGRQDAVWNGDTHHEVFRGQTLAALAADGANAIALRVNAPPFEVEGSPLGNDAGAALAGKGAHFVKGRPWVLFALQALGTLGACLFYWNNLSHISLFRQK